VAAALVVLVAIAAAVGGVVTGGALTRTAQPRPGRVVTGTAARTAPLRSSCASVAHIGDSTSASMVSPVWLPDAARRLAAQYRDVGVRHARIDASGGRSIVEQLPGQRSQQRHRRELASICS